MAEENRLRIERIAVVGAGLMGHGIAQFFALAGLPVVITDRDESVLGRVLQRIRANLETSLGNSPGEHDSARNVLARVGVTPSLVEAASQADFVVEAVVENLNVKHHVYRQLEKACSEDAIIASTTSGFCVRDMAIALDHPERFLVTHFWNPPYLIPVVEVMPGELCSAEVVKATCGLLEAAGKLPVLVRKDVPGFIGNRLQHALRREAIAIVAEGIATPEDVDLVTRLSFGLRMPVVGPLETVDLAGLDLTLAIQSYLLPGLDRSTESNQLVRDKVTRGELGAKAGKGFYEWPPGHEVQVIRQRDEALLEMLQWMRNRGFLEEPPNR